MISKCMYFCGESVSIKGSISICSSSFVFWIAVEWATSDWQSPPQKQAAAEQHCFVWWVAAGVVEAVQIWTDHRSHHCHRQHCSYRLQRCERLRHQRSDRTVRIDQNSWQQSGH